MKIGLMLPIGDPATARSGEGWPPIRDMALAAEASGLDLGSFAAAAACRYAAEASHEEWITLMGAMGRARDPGASYLERALAYAMRENCSTEVTTAETAGEQDAGSEPEAAM